MDAGNTDVMTGTRCGVTGVKLVTRLVDQLTDKFLVVVFCVKFVLTLRNAQSKCVTSMFGRCLQAHLRRIQEARGLVFKDARGTIVLQAWSGAAGMFPSASANSSNYCSSLAVIVRIVDPLPIVV